MSTTILIFSSLAVASPSPKVHIWNVTHRQLWWPPLNSVPIISHGRIPSNQIPTLPQLKVCPLIYAQQGTCLPRILPKLSHLSYNPRVRKVEEIHLYSTCGTYDRTQDKVTRKKAIQMVINKSNTRGTNNVALNIMARAFENHLCGGHQDNKGREGE